jgi:hypothetical protein
LDDYGAKPVSDPLVSLNQVCELLAAHPSFRVIRVRQPSWLGRTIKQAGSYVRSQLWRLAPKGNLQTLYLYFRVVTNRDSADLLRRFFDGGYYASHYPEVRRTRTPLLWHYLFWGYRRGFDPSALFHTVYYLTIHTDVAASQVNPLLHYVSCGRREGRRCAPLC